MWLDWDLPNWACLAFVVGAFSAVFSLNPPIKPAFATSLVSPCSLIDLLLNPELGFTSLLSYSTICSLWHMPKEPRIMDQSPIHSPLDFNRHQIRLLILHPAQADEPIHCTLTTCFISTAERYEALSYVWGDVTITTPIYIGPRRTRFDATTNLACALSHLRYHDKDRILWVDALCINQTDDNEKSHQVRMMRKIYEGAKRVVAWLGPETPGAVIAIQALEMLAKDKNLHWGEGRDNRSGPSIDIEQGLALHIWFRDCTWWTRIWTVQEYVSAKDLVFVCGRISFSENTMERFIDHHSLHISCCPTFGILVNGAQYLIYHILEEIRSITRVKSGVYERSHRFLAGRFRMRQSTKPEDKVFGLIGLVKDIDEGVINYASSVGCVYESFTTLLIKSSQNLDTLSHVVHPHSVPLERSGGVSVPSWVTNWEAGISFDVSRVLVIRQEDLGLYNTSGGKSYNRLPSGSGLLTVEGVLWDSIALVGEALGEHPCPGNGAVYKSWCNMVPAKSPENDYKIGETVEDAFFITLCMDNAGYLDDDGWWRTARATKDPDYRTYKLWWQHVENVQHCDARVRGDSGDPLSVTEEVVAFDVLVFNSTCCRRFFISEKGYMGLAPAMAEPGDRIAVLFGGRVPYILRQNESGSVGTTWTFIGDSYVHGIMEGEVIEKLEKGEVESEIITLK